MPPTKATAAKKAAASTDEIVEPIEEDRGELPDVEFIPAIILTNRGVPVDVYRLENGELPEIDDEQEQPTRKLYLRFTANHVAHLEEAFDGLVDTVQVVDRVVKFGGDGKPLEGPAGPIYEEKIIGSEDRRFYGSEAFQRALQTKEITALREVFATVMGCSPEQAGNAMIPGKQADYTIAVAAAWSIAQGVDPTDAAKMLHAGRKALAAKIRSLGSELEKMTDEAWDETTGSPGPTG